MSCPSDLRSNSDSVHRSCIDRSDGPHSLSKLPLLSGQWVREKLSDFPQDSVTGHVLWIH